MDKVLITGTSRGVGKALKHEFEHSGAEVLGYRRDELGDIRDPATIDKLMVLAEESGVNILVNNAGLYSPGHIDDVGADEIGQVVAVNLVAPIVLTAVLWPILVANRGTVVFINSMAGRQPERGEIAYRASKYGLTGFSASLFFDGQRDGVRVVDIPFGGMNTDMLKGRRKGLDKDPLLQPEEAARIVLKVLAGQPVTSHPLVVGQIIDSAADCNI